MGSPFYAVFLAVALRVASHRPKLRSVITCAILLALGALSTESDTDRPAEPEAVPARAEVRALEVTGTIEVDGRLSESQWARAPVFDAFVQIYPLEGGRPSERTELRILYDERTVYVGITAEDSRPERIRRNLGPRDSVPSGDSVLVALDPGRTRRTGYMFVVGAGGVIEDRLLYDDTGEQGDWDGVWEGAAAVGPHGWSAELAIPVAIMRFPPGDVQRWGVYVERSLARTNEQIASKLIPLGSGGFVSRFGEVRVDGIAPRTDAELAPFIAARTLITRLPGTERRDLYPSADIGLDFRAALSPHLVLSGAVNPDFGQVEADPVVLNLTRYELFFPEKRPLFLHGMDLFEPVGGGSGGVAQQLIYTRRIGQHAPILGAAKLVGDATAGLEFSVLEALVAGAGAEDRRGVVLDAVQPLRIGRAEVLPPRRPTPVNYLAFALKRGVAEASSVGLTAALATPLEACDAAAADSDEPPAACDVAGGNGVAADWVLRTRGGKYGTVGQVVASHAFRGHPLRILPDGTELRPGDIGVGAYAAAGKLGGEPFRFAFAYEGASPRLELNATGFQPSQNDHIFRWELDFIRPTGFGGLRGFSASIAAIRATSADGRWLETRRGVEGAIAVVLPSYSSVGCDAAYDTKHMDLREIVATGIAYERPANMELSCSFGTSSNNPVVLDIGAAVGRDLRLGPLPAAWSWGSSAAVSMRPRRAFMTRISTEFAEDRVPGRFLEETDAALLFADLESRSLSLTFRQQILFGPRTSLDAYAQAFGARGRYAAFRQGSPADEIRARDLQPASRPADDHSFASTALRVNVVFRWEYRLGSVLHLVYTLAQDEDRPLGTSAVRPVLAGPRRDRATEALLLKLSYFSRIGS